MTGLMHRTSAPATGRNSIVSVAQSSTARGQRGSKLQPRAIVPATGGWPEMAGRALSTSACDAHGSRGGGGGGAIWVIRRFGARKVRGGTQFEMGLGREILGPVRLLAVPRPGQHVRAASPGFPCRGELLRPRRLGAGQVARFGPVIGEIVEFPRGLRSFCHEFPVAVADGAIALVFPHEWPRPLQRFGSERRRRNETSERECTPTSKPPRARPFFCPKGLSF